MTSLAVLRASELPCFDQLEVAYDAELQCLYSWMSPAPRPCFTPDLLNEIQRSERMLASQNGKINDKGKQHSVEYVVFASRVPGVFNLGGDLNLFLDAILRQDRASLETYAHLCIDNIYRRYRGFHANITTIALVQGKALGGGFESCLASDIIVAERQATFALPEVLFNMFPGMGALSFLTRRIGLRKAEDMITSGQVYSAKEMMELGIVDEVVEDGLGLEATRALIHHRQRRGKSHRALQLAKRVCQPVTLEELKSIVDVWVDAAMRLEARDLRMMARLVRAQDRLLAESEEEPTLEKYYASDVLLSSSR